MTVDCPVIGFTLGDPGGIGPEITLRTLDYFSSGLPFIPVIFGSRAVLDHPYLQSYVVHKTLEDFPDEGPLRRDVIYFKDCYPFTSFETRRPNAQNGLAAYHYIREAVETIQAGRVNGLVTAPLCKESFSLAELPYTGHTTLLKELTDAEEVSMLFHTSRLVVILATIHVPFKEVPDLITESLLRKKVAHAVQFMRACGNEDVHVAVAGLNPHAGENGLFGDEELSLISPSIEHGFFGEGVRVSGPLSADTLFYRAAQGEFDVVVALYHDQGLIPVKLMGFHEAVNVTVGLPFVRTSPDHGTAFDRAYEQPSNIESLLSATRLAMRLIAS